MIPNNWLSRTIYGSVIRHEREESGGFVFEPERKNPKSEVSFFIHDGKDLHIVQGFAGDTHSHVGFPYLEESLCSGRFNVLTGKLAANLHPDLMTLPLFEKIALDVMTEYQPVTARWEYFGEWYSSEGMIEQLEQKY